MYGWTILGRDRSFSGSAGLAVAILAPPFAMNAGVAWLLLRSYRKR